LTDAPIAQSKRKIAILGGGPGALSTAYALAFGPNGADFQITVYQMGWRLGGKCASRREANPPRRNLEHGLHVLGGFYHNTMAMMRACYAQWQSAGQQPLTWDGAFKPHNVVHLMEKKGQNWTPVRIPLPTNNAQPGIGYTELTPQAFCKTLLGWIEAYIKSHRFQQRQPAAMGLMPVAADGQKERALQLLHQLNALVPVGQPVGLDDGRKTAISDTVDQLVQIVRTFTHDADEVGPNYLILLEIGLCCTKGIFVDDIWLKGFDAINDQDLLQWFSRHGASPDALASSYARAGYDYLFAYLDGDTSQPSLAAGVGLRGLLRMLTTYHGSLFVHMLGGMGEIIFVPLYEVLKKRGVIFKFFHRVDALRLAADGKSVDLIELIEQAPLADDVSEYQPTIACGDRRSWPTHPDYRQLKSPTEEIDNAEDVWENPWYDGPNAKKITLKSGHDFDQIVAGISVSALEPICADLTAVYPSWKSMFSAQKTVRTIGAQFWLSASVLQLGWPNLPTILTGFREPLATWGDMSFLLPLEGGDSQDRAAALSLAYFCGPMQNDAITTIMPHQRTVERQKAVSITDKWIEQCLSWIWPDAAAQNGDLKPSLVLETHIQANNFPSDTYVLSPPNSIEARLRTQATGLDNLFLAGDWVRTGMDSGCVETAVMAGLQCARALGGWQAYIPGETDFPRP